MFHVSLRICPTDCAWTVYRGLVYVKRILSVYQRYTRRIVFGERTALVKGERLFAAMMQTGNESLERPSLPAPDFAAAS
jgi:hypothetical protein